MSDPKSFLRACLLRHARVDVVPERGDVYIIVEPDQGRDGAEPFHVRAAVQLAFELATEVPHVTTAAGTFGPSRVELRLVVPHGYRDWCYDLEQLMLDERVGTDAWVAEVAP